MEKMANEQSDSECYFGVLLIFHFRDFVVVGSL